MAEQCKCTGSRAPWVRPPSLRLCALVLATSAQACLAAPASTAQPWSWFSSIGISQEPSGLEDVHRGRMLLSSSRVGSVGVAIFLILFFMGVCGFICLLGSRTKTPWLYYLVSSSIFAIVFGVLAGSPKGQAKPKPPEGYDQTIIPMTIIMIFLCIGIVLSWVGMLIFRAAPQHYAKPLSYQADVLRTI